jgi:hypothetical protein
MPTDILKLEKHIKALCEKLEKGATLVPGILTCMKSLTMIYLIFFIIYFKGANRKPGLIIKTY